LDRLIWAPFPSSNTDDVVDDDAHYLTMTTNEIFRLMILMITTMVMANRRLWIVSVLTMSGTNHKLRQLNMRHLDIPIVMANKLDDSNDVADKRLSDVEISDH
jgi:hypothetical protein